MSSGIDSKMKATLSLSERFAWRVGELMNETRLGQGLTTAYKDRVVMPAIRALGRDRLLARGEENLPKDRGFILAANHRTFFDLPAVVSWAWALLGRAPHLYCPVRSEWWYEGLVGTVMNLAVTGHGMYPPVFRDSRGPLLNAAGVDACVRLLKTDPRAVVAIHPEGKRNRGAHPYELLPPKPGVGRIALRSGAPVIPVFVAGLPPTMRQILRETRNPKAQPVRMFFGPPVDLSDLAGRVDDREAHREAAARTAAAIAECGARERAFMWGEGHPS